MEAAVQFDEWIFRMYTSDNRFELFILKTIYNSMRWLIIQLTSDRGQKASDKIFFLELNSLQQLKLYCLFYNGVAPLILIELSILLKFSKSTSCEIIVVAITMIVKFKSQK